MKVSSFTLGAAMLLTLMACGGSIDNEDQVNSDGEFQHDKAWALDQYQGKPATLATVALQHEAEKLLPGGDFLDGSMMKEHSKESLIKVLPAGVGALDVNDFAFVEGKRPEQIHPSVYADMRERSKNSGLYQLDGVSTKFVVILRILHWCGERAVG
jgi:hypothetical protein